MVMPAIGHVPGPPAELELSIASTFDDVEAHRAVVAGGFGMQPRSRPNSSAAGCSPIRSSPW